MRKARSHQRFLCLRSISATRSGRSKPACAQRMRACGHCLNRRSTASTSECACRNRLCFFAELHHARAAPAGRRRRRTGGTRRCRHSGICASLSSRYGIERLVPEPGADLAARAVDAQLGNHQVGRGLVTGAAGRRRPSSRSARACTPALRRIAIASCTGTRLPRVVAVVQVRIEDRQRLLRVRRPDETARRGARESARIPRIVLPKKCRSARRARLTELFLGFLSIGARSFGGVMPWAHRVMVEERRWVTRGRLHRDHRPVPVPARPERRQCLDRATASAGSALTGSLVAFLGLFALPFVWVLTLFVLYADFAATNPTLRAVVTGVGAAGAGMFIGTAIKLGRPLARKPAALVLIIAACFLARRGRRASRSSSCCRSRSASRSCWRARGAGCDPARARALLHAAVALLGRRHAVGDARDAALRGRGEGLDVAARSSCRLRGRAGGARAEHADHEPDRLARRRPRRRAGRARRDVRAGRGAGLVRRRPVGPLQGHRPGAAPSSARSRRSWWHDPLRRRSARHAGRDARLAPVADRRRDRGRHAAHDG